MKNKNILLLSVFIMLLSIIGCRVTLLPPYDEQLADQIGSTAKEVDLFYLNIAETTENEGGQRAYSNFAAQYAGIEAELNSLLYKNKVRPLNENSTRICEITLELWKKYKIEHKEDDEISDGVIELNRMTFNDLFYAMRVAEQAKDMITKYSN